MEIRQADSEPHAREFGGFTKLVDGGAFDPGVGGRENAYLGCMIAHEVPCLIFG